MAARKNDLENFYTKVAKVLKLRRFILSQKPSNCQRQDEQTSRIQTVRAAQMTPEFASSREQSSHNDQDTQKLGIQIVAAAQSSPDLKSSRDHSSSQVQVEQTSRIHTAPAAKKSPESPSVCHVHSWYSSKLDLEEKCERCGGVFKKWIMVCRGSGKLVCWRCSKILGGRMHRTRRN